MGNVVGMGGDPIPSGDPNPDLVSHLEDILEMARSGEIGGCATIMLHSDRTASYRFGGLVGGWSMLGALQIVQSHLVAIDAGE